MILLKDRRHLRKLRELLLTQMCSLPQVRMC